MKLTEVKENVDPFTEPTFTDKELEQFLSKKYFAINNILSTSWDQISNLQKKYPAAMIWQYQIPKGLEDRFKPLHVPSIPDIITSRTIFVDSVFTDLRSRLDKIVTKLPRIIDLRARIKKQLVVIQKKNIASRKTTTKSVPKYGNLVPNPSYDRTKLWTKKDLINPYYEYSDPKYHGSPDRFIWPGSIGLLYKDLIQKLKTFGINDFDVVYSATKLDNNNKKLTYFMAIGCDGKLVWEGNSRDTGNIYMPGDSTSAAYLTTSSNKHYNLILQKFGEKYK